MKHNVMERNEIIIIIVVNYYWPSKKRGLCVSLNTVSLQGVPCFVQSLRWLFINNFNILSYQFSQITPDVKYTIIFRYQDKLFCH